MSGEPLLYPSMKTLPGDRVSIGRIWASRTFTRNAATMSASLASQERIRCTSARMVRQPRSW